MALKTKLVDEFNTISNMGMLNKKLQILFPKI